MKKIKSQKIKSIIRWSFHRWWIAVLLCLIMGILCTVWAYHIDHQELSDPLPIKEVNDIGVYSSVVIDSDPYLFASNTDTKQNCYILVDINGDMSLAILSDQTYNDIVKQFHLGALSVEITGISDGISDVISALAMEAYNELLNAEVLTENNIFNYIGDFQLDNTQTLHDSIIQWLTASIFYVVALICLLISIVQYWKIKKQLDNLDDLLLEKIDQEAQQDYVIFFKRNRIILTDSYLIYMGRTLIILTYDEIAWIYEEPSSRLHLRLFMKMLVLIDKNEQIYHLPSMNGLSQKSKDQYLGFIQTLLIKNNQILVGYTSKMIEKYQKKYIK